MNIDGSRTATHARHGVASRSDYRPKGVGAMGKAKERRVLPRPVSVESRLADTLRKKDSIKLRECVPFRAGAGGRSWVTQRH